VADRSWVYDAILLSLLLWAIASVCMWTLAVAIAGILKGVTLLGKEVARRVRQD
jgi:hypothetical protein